MRQLLVLRKRLEGEVTFGFAWVYLVSSVAALAGLFLPFGRQVYGCPPGAGCLLLAAVAEPTLAQVLAGTALLGLLSGAVLLGLLSLIRPARLLFLVGLLLSLAALTLVSVEAATARSWLSPWPQDPLPVNLEAGFYLATIGSACASLMALVLFVKGSSQPWKRETTGVSLGFAWAYPVAIAVGLAGVLVPFVWEPFPDTQWSLAQGQEGSVLLALVLVTLVVGGLTVIRLSTPIGVAQLVLPVATLTLTGLDAADPSVRVLQVPSGSVLPLTFAPGFYLAVIGSTSASLLTLLLLVRCLSHPRLSRGTAASAAAT